VKRWIFASTLALVLVTVAAPTRAHAQMRSLGDQLADVRTGNQSELRDGGWFLAGFGTLSFAGGIAVAAAGNQDPLILWTGISTAAWGLINALFGLTLMDLGHAEANDIAHDRTLTGHYLRRTRDEELSQAHQQAAMFALNVGLDVAYIVSGILIAYLASEQRHLEWLEAFGITMASQGLVLGTFDLTEWIQSGGRAGRIMAVDPR
jgi:hypothetical protein